MRVPALLGVCALAVGVASVRSGDPDGALSLLAFAEREEPGNQSGPLHLDAARELARVKPWQAEYARCQRALAVILSERRSAYR